MKPAKVAAGRPAPAQNRMAAEPPGKLLLSMSLPIMLSMIMEALYNVVDSLFVARVSEKALTAVSLAFPVQLLAVSVAVGTSVGVGACLSRNLGAHNQRGVDTAAGNGVFLAALNCAAFLLFGIFLARPYFAWQTGNAEIRRMGAEYLSVCMIFSIGSVGQITFQRLLQSTGRTALSMVSQFAGAAINIIFDPILIFGLFGFPRMGVRGAAAATVAGQIIALCLAVYFNLSKNKEILFSAAALKPDKKMIKEIYSDGAPAIFNQSLNSLMAFGVNFILIRLSATAVAAFGIYIKVQNFIFMPAFGLNNGVIAIAAFNFGAKNKKRIDTVIKFGMMYAACIMLAGMVLLLVFVDSIVGLFGASAELRAIGSRAMRIISLGYLFAAFTLIAQGIYQALGNGVYSLIITLMRVVVVLLPVLYIFAHIFEISAVWWAFVMAEAFSALVGAFLLKRIYRQKVAPLETENRE
jgi:putative MATE family efflux protein